MIGELIIGFEDAVGEPVVPHELPDIFDWIELWTFGRQRYDADILGYDERVGHEPPGLIHEHDGKGTGATVRDFYKMQVHRVSIAGRQDKRCALAQGRADRSKDVGRCGSLIMWCRWTCPALCPPTRDLVFLTYAGLVLEPDFHCGALRKASASFCQFGCKPPF